MHCTLAKRQEVVGAVATLTLVGKLFSLLLARFSFLQDFLFFLQDFLFFCQFFWFSLSILQGKKMG